VSLFVARPCRWNALESVNQTSWAGSALLGGVLADSIGYRHVFLITASLQLLAVLLYSPLVYLVATEAMASKGRQTGVGTCTATAGSEPLLTVAT
jgi:hypothetical protein